MFEIRKELQTCGKNVFNVQQNRKERIIGGRHCHESRFPPAWPIYRQEKPRKVNENLVTHSKEGQKIAKYFVFG